MGYPPDASLRVFRRDGMRRYAPPAVNSHAVYTVVAGQSAHAASYSLPLHDLDCIVRGNETVLDCLGKQFSVLLVFVAGTGRIATERAFLRMEWLCICDNGYEVIAKGLHQFAFLD